MQSGPALRYVSAFADYKPWQETPPSDWRAVNDALLKDVPKGSHAGHGMTMPAAAGASSPVAAPAPKASPGTPATSKGHGAHGTHGGQQ
jgi:hypothetical protein